MKKKRIVNIVSLVFIILATIGLIASLFRQVGGEEAAKPDTLTYNEFVSAVEKGEIAKVFYNIQDPKISGEYKTKGDEEPKRFITDNPQTVDFKKYLLEQNVDVQVEVPSSKVPFSSLLISIVQMMLWLGMILMIIRYGSKLVMKSTEKMTELNLTTAKKVDVTFADVAGNEEAKEDMSELVDFLKNASKYKKYGSKIPRGTILFGPPGTGKTLMAKALAGTAGVSFFAISGSDFVEKYVGVGAARVRQLFEAARKNAPSIVFIDELDAVGKKRGGAEKSNDERDQTLNQILVEMDGFTGNEGVIVIAATNRLDSLDQALLRSGRFDRQIFVGLPDLDAREDILRVHSKNKPLANEVDLRDVAKLTTGMSGADLENVMNEASIYAARFNHKHIEMTDIDRAINKMVAGDEKKNRKGISVKEREITAYHEAGHALIAKLLTNKSIPKVTIIPTTKGAGGYTLIAPEEKMFESKRGMLNEIAILLGGRAAEEIVFGKDEITGGANSDLRRVTQIAIRMVKHYGMSEAVGLVNVEDLYGNSLTSSTDKLIAEEIRSLIHGAYQNTVELLNLNKAVLSEIAQALLERETIFESELNVIFKGESLKSPGREHGKTSGVSLGGVLKPSV